MHSVLAIVAACLSASQSQNPADSFTVGTVGTAVQGKAVGVHATGCSHAVLHATAMRNPVLGASESVVHAEGRDGACMPCAAAPVSGTAAVALQEDGAYEPQSLEDCSGLLTFL